MFVEFPSSERATSQLAMDMGSLFLWRPTGPTGPTSSGHLQVPWGAAARPGWELKVQGWLQCLLTEGSGIETVAWWGSWKAERSSRWELGGCLRTQLAEEKEQDMSAARCSAWLVRE